MPKVDVLEERVNTMIEQNAKEHGSIHTLLNTINQKLDDMDNQFVTRKEFALVMTIVMPIVTGFIGLIIAKVTKAY